MENAFLERDAYPEPPCNILNDPVFQVLLHRFSQSCVSWNEFIDMPMPPGISPRQVWELLNTLSKALGVPLAVPDLEDNWYWYRRTHYLTDAVAVVSRACSSDSYLFKVANESSKKHFLFKTKIKETISAACLDGLSIEENDVNALLSFDYAPQTATERLIVNGFNAVNHLPSLAERMFSRELFSELRELLLEGLDISEIETVDNPPLGITLFDWPRELCEKFADRQMDYISSWANHETGDVFDHVAIRAIIINDCFRFYRPLGLVSNQVGRLVAHLYAIKHDLPVLGLLPSSRAKLNWYRGKIIPPRVSFSRDEFVQLRLLSPYDLTSMATIAVQLMLIALDEVEQDVKQWERNNEELSIVLSADKDLNHRQRIILGQALKNPDEEFSIRYHRNSQGIAYPTARRDFLELVDRGYLAMHKRDRTFIFTASSGLQALVGKNTTP